MPLKADINVAPLADVVLVLVINLMMFVPMHVGNGAAVWLPDARHSTIKRDRHTETVLSIDFRGHFYVNAYPVMPEELVPRVRRARDETTNKAVFVQADRDARYAAVMRAMDALRQAEIDDVALMTARPSGER